MLTEIAPVGHEKIVVPHRLRPHGFSRWILESEMKVHAGLQAECGFLIKFSNQLVDGLLAMYALHLGENDARGIANVAATKFNLNPQQFSRSLQGHAVPYNVGVLAC